MARSRNIKPSLFKNEILGEADPLLTLLFEGLWCLADRAGRLEDRPKRIKAEIFPYREIPDINGYLTVLAQLGFIDRYTAGGVEIIQVINFEKHQSPHKTEKASELPEKPLNTGGCFVTDKAPLNNESAAVKESLIPDSLSTDSLKEQPAKKQPSRKTQLHIKELPIDWIQYCLTKRPELIPETVFENFSDFYLGHGRAMQDWTRTWQRWVRNEKTNGTTIRHQPRESSLQHSERTEREYFERLGVNLP